MYRVFYFILKLCIVFPLNFDLWKVYDLSDANPNESSRFVGTVTLKTIWSS